MKLIHTTHQAARKAWGCPITKNRSNWCHARCTPQEGLGDCGRIAPHALRGRTQLAILAHKAQQG